MADKEPPEAGCENLRRGRVLSFPGNVDQASFPVKEPFAGGVEGSLVVLQPEQVVVTVHFVQFRAMGIDESRIGIDVIHALVGIVPGLIEHDPEIVDLVVGLCPAAAVQVPETLQVFRVGPVALDIISAFTLPSRLDRGLLHPADDIEKTPVGRAGQRRPFSVHEELLEKLPVLHYFRNRRLPPSFGGDLPPADTVSPAEYGHVVRIPLEYHRTGIPSRQDDRRIQEISPRSDVDIDRVFAGKLTGFVNGCPDGPQWGSSRPVGSVIARYGHIKVLLSRRHCE